MSSYIVIRIKNVTKRYKLFKNHADRVKETFHPFRKKYHRPFSALNDVSFDVKRGEAVGIIGSNGSGKSTLLQIVCGILTPSLGRVEVYGRISALLELGAGFSPEFTGIENIYLNGSIMGYSREEINQILEDIISFADIGDFVYQPVKIYSSGMYVRLAFAVAINLDPDILIVDEALAVGDIRFQQKCFRRIKDIKKKASLLFISHDMATVINLCDRVVWLDKGRICLEGTPEKVCKEYTSYMSYGAVSETEQSNNEVIINSSKRITSIYDIDKLPDNLTCFGDGGAKITGASLFDSNLTKIAQVKGGEKVKLAVRAEAYEPMASPILGFIVKDRLGNNIFGSNTYVLNTHLDKVYPNDEFIVSFHFLWPKIVSGYYSITFGLADGTQLRHVQKHWVYDGLVVESISDPILSNVSGLLIVDEIVAEMEKI